jgi:xanthine dehydrogenase accessory factor
MKRQTLDRLNAARADKRPVALVTETASGAQWLAYTDDVSGDAALNGEVLRQARMALSDDKSAGCDVGGLSYFIQVHSPPLRLFIVGAVHITQALARIAMLAGYTVTVIDPRRAFAEAERFPGLEVTSDWPDDVLTAAGLDRRSAVVTLSHDPKIDDPALHTVLKSDVFYIGSLGSKRTHGKRLERLEENGFSAAEMARINSPVGLDIGAKSPAEIAISIMGEITQARRRPASGAA